LAAIENYYDLVVWLVEIVRVKINSKNSHNRTPLDEATLRGHVAIVAYFHEKSEQSTT